MHRIWAASLLLMLVAAPGHAREGTAGLEAETYLVEGKTMVSASGYFFFSNLGIDGSFGLMYLDEEVRGDGLDGTFIGGVMTAHLVYRIDVTPLLSLRVGTGLDYYALWGLDDEEAKAAWPVLAEARVFLGPTLNAFVQPRYYILRSDGLEPGKAADGDEGLPLVIAVGIGGEWR